MGRLISTYLWSRCVHANVVTADRDAAEVMPELSFNGSPKTNQRTTATVYHYPFSKAAQPL